MRHIFIALCALCVLATDLASAHDDVNAIAFDCWIFTDKDGFNTEHIRCIRDRDTPPPDHLVSPERAMALEHAHRLIHTGEMSALNQFIRDNTQVFGSGDFWTIRIWNYPSQWSWDEGLPQKLVESMLCPKTTVCHVFIWRR